MSLKWDYAAFGEQVLCADWMKDLMVAYAETAKATAEAIAPVDVDGPHPGLYKASFEVSSGIREGKTRRAYGRLTNTAPYSVQVEQGTSDTPAHHTLLKSLGGAHA